MTSSRLAETGARACAGVALVGVLWLLALLALIGLNVSASSRIAVVGSTCAKASSGATRSRSSVSAFSTCSDSPLTFATLAVVSRLIFSTGSARFTGAEGAAAAAEAAARCAASRTGDST